MELPMEELLCPICLDVFEDPVTTNCGHSFCKSCLYIVDNDVNDCPVCRKLLSTVNLRSNVTLRNIVEKYHRKTPGGASVDGASASRASYLMDFLGFDVHTFERYTSAGLLLPCIDVKGWYGLIPGVEASFHFPLDLKTFPVNDKLEDEGNLINRYVVLRMPSKLYDHEDVNENSEPKEEYGILIELETGGRESLGGVQISGTVKSLVCFVEDSLVFETLAGSSNIVGRLSMVRANGNVCGLDFSRIPSLSPKSTPEDHLGRKRPITPKDVYALGEMICLVVKNHAQIRFGTAGYRIFSHAKGELGYNTELWRRNVHAIKYLGTCLKLSLELQFWSVQMCVRLLEGQSSSCGTADCEGDCNSVLDDFFCGCTTSLDRELYMFYSSFFNGYLKPSKIYVADVAGLTDGTWTSKLIALTSSGGTSLIFLFLVLLFLFLISGNGLYNVKSTMAYYQMSVMGAMF